MKKILRLICVCLCMVSLFTVVGCMGLGGGSNAIASNEYIEITSIEVKEENYEFDITIKNVSNEDLTVVVRVFLSPNGVINSSQKKIACGGSYTFNCYSGLGKIHDNPKGIVAIYNSNGEGVGTLSFEK